MDLSRIQDFAQGDPVSALVNLVWAQAKTKGRTGWSIKVVSPETAWRAEREKFTQPVLRDALVVDIALAIVSAIERGDQLWDAD